MKFTESIRGHWMKKVVYFDVLKKLFRAGVAYSSFQKEVEVYDVDYCGYVQLRRPIFKKDQSFTAGEFEAIVHNGQTGIKCIPNKTAQ